LVATIVSMGYHNQESKMTEVANVDAKAAIARARREIQEEAMKKAVDKLKAKLREREAAATVLANVDREIKDLELAIEQGNA
jgi:hypothetical protein